MKGIGRDRKWKEEKGKQMERNMHNKGMKTN